MISVDSDVYIRPLTLSDQEYLAKMADNKKIWLNVRDVFPHPYTPADATTFIEHTLQENPAVTFAIEYRGKFCGVIGLTLQHDVYRKNAELGFWVGEEYWNKNIMTGAVELIVQYGWNTLDLHRIYANVFEYNPASMRVLEKNKFLSEGISYHSVYKSNQYWNEHRYAKTKTRIIPILPEDIPDVVRLVNETYRGPVSKKGWTTEADLLEGLRIDEPMLRQMNAKPSAVVMKYLNQDDAIEGCIYLEAQDKKLYVGLVTVSPHQQSKGIGKDLLAMADRQARLMNKESLYMTVISIRHEIIAWYERHGYRKTGEVRPFPAEGALSVPKQPLEMIVLEKKLSL